MFEQSVKDWMKHIDFILLDIICLLLSFLCGYRIIVEAFRQTVSVSFIPLFLILIPMDLLCILLFDTMKNVLKRKIVKELIIDVLQSLFLWLFIYLYSKLNCYFDRISVNYVCVSISLYFLITFVVRMTWKFFVLRLIKKNKSSSLLIVTSHQNASKLFEKNEIKRFELYKAVGLVFSDTSNLESEYMGIPIVASLDNLASYVLKNWVDEIILFINPQECLSDNLMDSLLKTGVTIHFSFDSSLCNNKCYQSTQNICGIPVITTSMNKMSGMKSLIKRTMDVFGGLIGCFFTGILYLFLAPAIYFKSPGPIFFSQERIGKNGKPFLIYKFRSMYMDAEERKAELMSQNRLSNNLMFKLDFDPRVIGNYIDKNGKQKTGIGEFIRKTSLDEFPQFFNVLKGDMSLVGTRPPLRSEVDQYLFHHKSRLACKPGITGLWQVSGRSNILDFEEVVRLDSQYIKEWSLLLDLKILLKTIVVVLKKQGSM